MTQKERLLLKTTAGMTAILMFLVAMDWIISAAAAGGFWMILGATGASGLLLVLAFGLAMVNKLVPPK